MALSDILQKITSDAESEVKNILDEARKESHSIEKEAQKKSRDFDAQSEIAIDRRSSKVAGRILNKARHDIKMKEDESLRGIVDAVFESVEKKLTSLPESKQKELLEKNMKSLPDEKGVFHIAPEQEKELKHLIQKSHKSSEVKVADKNTLLGGFIFETKDREFDFSFRTLLKNLRKEKEIEVSQKIIASNNGH